MKTETFIKQAPIAIAAIGQHMVDYDLPITTSIDVYPHDQTIRIRVTGGQAGLNAWLETLAVDAEENEAVAHPAVGYRTAWTVRLPDLGIRFELVGFRTDPLLSAVSA